MVDFEAPSALFMPGGVLIISHNKEHRGIP